MRILKSHHKCFQIKNVFLFHSLSPFPCFFCFYFSVHFWPIPIFRIDSYRPPALPPDLLTPWLATPKIAPFLLGGLLDWHPCAWLLGGLGPAPCSTMPLCQSQTAVGPSGTCHSDTPTSKSYQLCYCQYQNCFNILNVQTTPLLPWKISIIINCFTMFKCLFCHVRKPFPTLFPSPTTETFSEVAFLYFWEMF